MIAEKMKPSLITYTSMLQILIKTKRIQNAIHIFDEILKLKLNPDQVMFNVIINGCVFNGRLDDACRFLFESFKANIKLCGDVYKNVLNNLLTNRLMEINYKNDITLRICKELKTRGCKIDYEIYYKVMKMIYKSHGKQSDQIIQREVDEYKKSVNESYEDDNQNDNRKSYYKNSYNDQKPRNTKYTTYNNFNSGTPVSNTTATNGKWRK
jgi:pentatricopeptide repeat protein